MGPGSANNDRSTDDFEGKFEAWESIHNDPDYDPKEHSEPGFPDYDESNSD